MFYVKERITKGTTVSVNITDKNVYCRCPGCGAEVQVNLEDVFKVKGVNLIDTEVLCDRCPERVQRRRHGNK